MALPETFRPPLGAAAQARTYSGLVGQARLRQLSDAADPATRTFDARFMLAGAPADAAPLGSTVTIRLNVPGQAADVCSARSDLRSRPGSRRLGRRRSRTPGSTGVRSGLPPSAKKLRP